MKKTNTVKKHTTDSGLSTLANLALSKAFAHGVPEEFSLVPGEYSGSSMVQVDWTLTKGLPTTRKPTSNLLSKAVLAKALVLSGIQVENFLAALKQAALLELSQPDPDVAEKLKNADPRIEKMIVDLETEVISKLPRNPIAGSTSVEAEVTVIPAVLRDEIKERMNQPALDAGRKVEEKV